jgi:hypothetical protein
MKPIRLEFMGGDWDGRTLRSDSPEYEEQLLAIGIYELSHHGAVGGACKELTAEAVDFARRHAWLAIGQGDLPHDGRYQVVEHRETEVEIIVTFSWKC